MTNLNWKTVQEVNPHESSLKQIKKSLDILKEIWGHEEKKINNFFNLMKEPKRILEINIPVKMDNWDLKFFKWYRSQHNDLRWPFKWGIRFHQDVNIDEVKALSTWMTIKTSVIWLPIWWGKWWIIVNPKELSEKELEQLSRWYVREIYKYIGPWQDVPAPDVNTTPQIMTWMMNEYSNLTWKYTPSSFTGKPILNGGSLWRWTATATGWIIVLKEFLDYTWDKIEWKTVSIQWAWNAWLIAASILKEKWALITCISDSSWTIFMKDWSWLNIWEIERIKIEKKSLKDLSETSSKFNFSNWTKDPLNSELNWESDIIIAAALENQITKENAETIKKGTVILELANWPVTPEADEILFNNWVTVIPDVLANAGGVAVSYLEQVQWDSNYYYSEKEVEAKLNDYMTKAFVDINTLYRLWFIQFTLPSNLAMQKPDRMRPFAQFCSQWRKRDQSTRIRVQNVASLKLKQITLALSAGRKRLGRRVVWCGYLHPRALFGGP